MTANDNYPWPNGQPITRMMKTAFGGVALASTGFEYLSDVQEYWKGKQND